MRRMMLLAVAAVAALAAVSGSAQVVQAGSVVPGLAFSAVGESSGFTGAEGRIAFVRRSSGENGSPAEIYVMNPDGGSQQRLIQKRTIDSPPAWSPDGQWIAFITGGHEIRVMRAEGSGERMLTRVEGVVVTYSGSLPAVVGPLAWSPDGRRVAFAVADTDRQGSRAGIWVVDTAGRQRRLTRAAGNSPTWSPDGRRIAFVSSGISVMNADGTGQRRRAEGDSPAWSPDGRRIAFSSAGAIYVMARDGSRQRKLTTTLRSEGYTWDDFSGPTWSPEGDTVAFSGHYGSPNHPPEAGSLFIINADGAGQRRLTHEKPYEYSYSPTWSPDSRRIAFVGNNSSTHNTEIYAVNADGRGRQRLTTNKNDDGSPTWSPEPLPTTRSTG